MITKDITVKDYYWREYLTPIGIRIWVIKGTGWFTGRWKPAVVRFPAMGDRINSESGDMLIVALSEALMYAKEIDKKHPPGTLC